MYHIPDDKRARKSAELIWQGMEQCLQTKPLAKLRVTDIYQASFISRATFYRLFDSVQDVLAYRCDQIYCELAQALDAAGFRSKQEFFLCLIQKWLEQEVLIKTLVENNMTSVIYETHRKNSGLMKRIFLHGVTISEQEADYLVAILSNLIPAAVTIWYLHGKTETPEEIYRAVSQSLTVIGTELAPKKRQ